MTDQTATAITSPLPLVSQTRRRLQFLTILALLIMGLASFFMTLAIFAAELRPVHSVKVQSVLRGASDEIARAVNLGVPLNRLEGLDKYLDVLQSSYPEIARLYITSWTPAKTHPCFVQKGWI